jgi:hypothetical protein
VIPDQVVPFNVYNILLVEALPEAGDVEAAKQITDVLTKNVYQDMDYFISLGKKYDGSMMYEKGRFYTLDN